MNSSWERVYSGVVKPQSMHMLWLIERNISRKKSQGVIEWVVFLKEKATTLGKHWET